MYGGACQAALARVAGSGGTHVCQSSGAATSVHELLFFLFLNEAVLVLQTSSTTSGCKQLQVRQARQPQPQPQAELLASSCAMCRHTFTQTRLVRSVFPCRSAELACPTRMGAHALARLRSACECAVTGIVQSIRARRCIQARVPAPLRLRSSSGLRPCRLG